MKRALFVAAFVLASCATPSQRPTLPSDQAELPLAPYEAALGSHAVYRVDSHDSRVDIIVRRAGTLQRFGHDHVITAENIAGYVLANESGGSRADLLVDLRELRVDEPAARDVYGLKTDPTDSDIAGTAQNLQQKVLQTETWPYAQIAVRGFQAEDEWARCDVTLTLKGNSLTLPVDVLVDNNQAQLSARGVFTLRQTDLAIQPFSLLGGALSVADRLDIYFRISAEPVESIEP